MLGVGRWSICSVGMITRENIRRVRFPLFSKIDGHKIVGIDTLSNLSFRGDGFLARICGRRSFSALLLRGYGFARLESRGARVNRRESISLILRIYSRMLQISVWRPGGVSSYARERNAKPSRSKAAHFLDAPAPVSSDGVYITVLTNEVCDSFCIAESSKRLRRKSRRFIDGGSRKCRN